MQPDNAIITLPTGTIGDMAFSPDGKTIYVARAGTVTAYNVADGSKIRDWAIGSQLGGMDVSSDGKFLIATELKPGPGTGSGAGYKAEAYVYRLDLTTGGSVKYTAVTTGNEFWFHDVSFMSNDTALLIRPQYGSPAILDFAKGEFKSAKDDEYSIDGGFLSSTPDKSHVIIMPSDSYDAPVFNYEPGKGITGANVDPKDGVSGYNGGVQAISVKGDMIAQGAGLTVYDGDLKVIAKLGDRYPTLPAISGLAFSPAGDKLYVLSSLARQLVVFDTKSWTVIEGYSVGGPVSESSNFGDSLLVSADGKTVAIAGDVSVRMLDLTRAVVDRGTDGKDSLVGDSDANWLLGFDGDDLIDGKGGDDILFGGRGNDTFHIESNGDLIGEQAGEGTDRAIVSISGYALPGEVEILELAGPAVWGSGNDGANSLIGNAHDNNLNGLAGDDRLEGHDGDDHLIGGTGNDTLIGGKGYDTYYVDSPGDVIVELAGEGVDTVSTAISYTLGDHLENLTLQWGTESLSGTGNALENTLEGNAGDNKLFGRGGDDTLRGGDGADTLDGGAGSDRIDGGGGDDIAFYDGKRSDYLVIASGGGFRINDTRGGGGDSDFVINVEAFRFASGELSATQLRDTADGVASDWRMFASDGFAGKIDAGGTVIGTTGKQDVAVLDTRGRVTFDSSFNRGGDVIRLSGAASEWTVERDGSNAVLERGGTSVAIPLGVASTAIVFSDGARNLAIDVATQTARIGDQALTGEIAPLRAAADAPAPNVSGDPAASARLFLEASGDVTVSGAFTVIGTTEAEKVTVLAGKVTLDSSFNLGGDTIVLDAAIKDFTAVRSGSNAVLHSGAIDLSAPAGLKGMQLAFDDGERTLRINESIGAIVIGDQALTLTPAPLAVIA